MITIEKNEYEELSNLISSFDSKLTTANIHDALEAGAEAFTHDVQKLPRPRSGIMAPDYFHMLDLYTFWDSRNKRKKDQAIVTGWLKRYGYFVEYGTPKARAQPHVKPLYRKNQKKYESKMVDKIMKLFE